GVSVLHALWDSMHSIAVVVTLLLTGTPSQYGLLQQGYLPQPTDEQASLFTGVSWGGLAVVSLIGILWLLAVRRQADREARAFWHIRLASGGPRRHGKACAGKPARRPREPPRC